jgi:hypothetical protein
MQRNSVGQPDDQNASCFASIKLSFLAKAFRLHFQLLFSPQYTTLSVADLNSYTLPQRYIAHASVLKHAPASMLGLWIRQEPNTGLPLPTCLEKVICRTICLPKPPDDEAD